MPVPVRVIAFALSLFVSIPVPAQAGGTTHVVQSGQTLGGIARRYNVTIEDVCSANSIQRSAPIRVGQALSIPQKRSPARRATKATRSTTGKQYTVVAGDTLGGIAHAHKVTISALAAANGIQRSDPIRIGQTLAIPRPGAPVETALKTHRVASGQTLGGIARRYNVTIAALTSANKISRSAPIRIGQELIVPPRGDEDGTRTLHAVEAGRDRVIASTRVQPKSADGVQRLDVPGAFPAYYYEPTGPGRKTLRPVLMYLHGRGAYPAQYCARWARVVRSFGWLVCPVGPEDRGGGKRGWGSNWAGGRRIVKATLAALRKKYGRRVQLYGNTIMGFSEGAFVAMNVGLREPRAFNRWLILGADTDYWSPAALQALRQQRASIRRVYLITGRRDIVYHETKRVQQWLRKVGVPVRASAPPDMGHTVALESKTSLYTSALRWLERG